MMNIGENILRLRRERGLTQEQLGNLVSVSAQAVSKWEKGGMPDTELLPAIADALHVTVDTLFGRADTQSADMEEIFYHWLLNLPEEKKSYEVFKLMLLALNSPIKTMDANLEEDLDGILKSLPIKSSNGSYVIGGEEKAVWMRSQIMDNYGMQLAVPAEDCPLFILLPEPEEGYTSNLKDPEEYRKLFSALSLPGSLEMLLFLYTKPAQFYSQGALEKNCDMDEGYLNEPLKKLSEVNLIYKRTVMEADGERNVYALNDDPGFVPFLMFARWLMEAPGYIWSWSSRTRPILTNKAEAENETKAKAEDLTETKAESETATKIETEEKKDKTKRKK